MKRQIVVLLLASTAVGCVTWYWLGWLGQVLVGIPLCAWGGFTFGRWSRRFARQVEARAREPKELKEPRIWQHMVAWITGFFWLPCPVCNRRFGGHEWDVHNVIRPHSEEPWLGQGVCSPQCKAHWEAEHIA